LWGKQNFQNRLLDLLIRNLSGFPINRGKKDSWVIRQAAKVLNHGQTLGMFPEGKHSKGVGWSVAKTGTARMAIEAGCPIVPMAVIGSVRPAFPPVPAADTSPGYVAPATPA